LPRSQNRSTLDAVDVALIVMLDIHQFLPISTRWHSTKPAVAQGSLEESVERVEAQVDEMPYDNSLMTLGLHHTRPFLSEFTPSATR
jgi:hypothetical protein